MKNTLSVFIASSFISLLPLVSHASYSASDLPQITGEAGSEAGSALATGDINGDGYDDLVVGAPRMMDQGYVYLVYGSENTFADSSLEDSVHFTSEDTSNLGSAVAVGDLNADGYDDLILASDETDIGLAGIIYIVYGQADRFASSTLSSDKNVVLTGQSSSENFGNSLTTADINGDGADDLFIGAYRHGSQEEGAVYLLYGTANAELSSATMSGSNIIFTGPGVDDELGKYISVIGDLNNDGYEDVAMAAWHGTTNDTGHIYILYGRSTAYTSTGIRTLANRFTGEASDDRTGTLAPAGDINGDGYDDLLVGSRRAASNKGETYIIYGKASQYSDGTLGTNVSYTGIISAERSGSSITGTDVDQDGYSDIVIGDDSIADYSYVYVVPGDTDLFSTTLGGYDSYVGTMEFDTFGSVLASGDYNHDGYGDIAVGAPSYTTMTDAPLHEGAVYMIYYNVDTDGDGITGLEGLNQGTDCDDTDATVSENQTYYQDNDGDDLGTTAATIAVCESTAPMGYADNTSDANDNDADNDGSEKGTDCNDDDATVSVEQTYYVDADLDDLGSDETALVCSSTATSGYSTNSDDEDDTIANLSYERAGDNADNDGDGEIDEDNTLAENGVHTGYDSLDPADSDTASTTLTRVRGRKNGKIRVTYSDHSSYIYTIYAGRSSRKTKVKQYDSLGFLVVLQSNSKKLSLVNAYTGEVYQRKTVNNKARRYADLKLLDVRNDDRTEAVVTNRKTDQTQVAIFKVNTSRQTLKKRSSLKVTNSHVDVSKTKKKRNKILLRNGRSRTLHQLNTNSNYKLSLVE